MPRLDIRRSRRISAHQVSDEPIRIGRSSNNDLVLRNIHVSRQHCIIERVNGELRLRDLASQSGTFLNGERVETALLFAGDRISVGPYDLVLRALPEDNGLISRNAALDSALSHVHIDEDTGIPLEGPAALIETLRDQVEQERQQYAQATAQIAALHRQLEEAETPKASVVGQEGVNADVESLRTELQQAHRALETERAHAADLNRAVEEAWAKVESFGAERDVLQAQVNEANDRYQVARQEADDAVQNRDAAAARIAEMEAELGRVREESVAAKRVGEQDRDMLRLDAAESGQRLALSRADELEHAVAEVREQLAAQREEAMNAARRHDAAIRERDERIATLLASEESLAQRLKNLEATRFAASEKAERALKSLNLLHGQIRSLDEAAARVNDLQGRLAQIEQAWVDADDLLERVDESSEDEVAAAVDQRQRIVSELDALNKARDAAITTLRDSATRLRSLADRETPSQPAPLGAAMSPPSASRRWWRIGKT